MVSPVLTSPLPLVIVKPATLPLNKSTAFFVTPLLKSFSDKFVTEPDISLCLCVPYPTTTTSPSNLSRFSSCMFRFVSSPTTVSAALYPR
ncbi:hypothetical protein D3C79_892510 [compost metagenome]